MEFVLKPGMTTGAYIQNRLQELGLKQLSDNKRISTQAGSQNPLPKDLSAKLKTHGLIQSSSKRGGKYAVGQSSNDKRLKGR